MRAVEWFAGVGGFGAALLSAGHEIVGVCEIDEAARKVYAARFGEPAWFARDIREVRADEIPESDLWCGGPPCQSFSVAGKRGGMDDARGNLFLRFLALAAIRKPPALLVENVPGLLSSDDGRDFGAILAALVAQGRRVAWMTLDARFFGVVQRRRRVFLCASLAGDPRAVLFDAGTKPRTSGAPDALVRGDTWYAPQEALFAREGAAPFDGAGWPGSGYAAGDRCWVRDVPEWREPVERASLAATLETGPIPARFFLSARACAGILRRAERRGRALPAALDAALRATADPNYQLTTSPAKTDSSLAFGANRTSGPREEAGALPAHGGASERLDFETETFVVGPIQAQGAGGRGHRVDAEAAATGHLVVDGDCVAAIRAGRRSGPDDNDAQAGQLVFAVRGTAQGGPPAEARDESMALQGKGCKPTGNEAGTVVLDVAPTVRAASGHHGRSSPRGDGSAALVAVAGQQHGSDVGAMGALRAGHGDVQSGVPFVVLAVDLQNMLLGAGDCAGTLDTTCPTRGGGQAVLAVEAPRRKMSGGAKVGDGVRADEAFTLDADPRGQGVLQFQGGTDRMADDEILQAVRPSNASQDDEGRVDGKPRPLCGEDLLRSDVQRRGEGRRAGRYASPGVPVLRRDPGTETPAGGGPGGSVSFHAEEVLQPEVHGSSLRRSPVTDDGMEHDALPREEDDPGGLMRALRSGEGAGCPPQRRGPHEQCHGEPGTDLPPLPLSPPQSGQVLLSGRLYSKTPNAQLLREARAAVQEVGRSACDETQPAHAAGAVRRLTPTCTERLQSFADGHTCLCAVECRKPDDRRAPPWWPAEIRMGGCGHAACGCKCGDGKRYQQMGNAVCVSVVRWIAGRLP